MHPYFPPLHSSKLDSGTEIVHGSPILRPTFNPMPIMMPPAKLAVTLEYCVDDIDVIANGIIDG
jgi:hypothetical protein